MDTVSLLGRPSLGHVIVWAFQQRLHPLDGSSRCLPYHVTVLRTVVLAGNHRVVSTKKHGSQCQQHVRSLQTHPALLFDSLCGKSVYSSAHTITNRIDPTTAHVTPVRRAPCRRLWQGHVWPVYPLCDIDNSHQSDEPHSPQQHFLAGPCIQPGPGSLAYRGLFSFSSLCSRSPAASPRVTISRLRRRRAPKGSGFSMKWMLLWIWTKAWMLEGPTERHFQPLHRRTVLALGESALW